ncbi:hypothetical protein A2153_00485 [Candidatus Gottesmanbacteria bacterium RBG_16_38_7b]|uniref:Hydrolase TatD n=1 Tax=Candidatus Gottesmanbacteria bacterium RBG_16_38_7b TaxID=1798372 RepID=A0A1F5YII7_9BACT|nr:MAG: hypothetical protein A2153_00485 [Candidatus Gottesmanbacteria bacterium RBG_16_38_7b]
MLIDTHCHLNFKAFKKDLDEVIVRAKESGVAKIIIPGAKIDSSRRAVEIAGKYDGIYAAVGTHPHHAGEDLDTDTLVLLTRDKKTVAVGEIGLDHYRYKNYPQLTEIEKDKQVTLFIEQLKIAERFNLPVIIHCRAAQEQLLKTLNNFLKKGGQVRGVFHCFEGTADYLDRVLELDFYIGFDGNITYPENKSLAGLVKRVPQNRLLLETDAPFLTPLPFRGTRNEPAYLTETAEFIAGILKIKSEDLANKTNENADRLFFVGRNL